jgi:hypothetical protein
MPSETMKIFSDPLGASDLSRLTSDPIEVADAAIEAILIEAEASQRNIFAKLAVTLRVANDRKIYARHVDQYGEPFKSMELWIKAMYPETWRYAKDAFSAAVAMPEVPIEDIADMKRCNAVLLADPGISPMTRRDPEIIEAAKHETEKEFREHINSRCSQHLEGPRTLKITGPESGIKKIESALDEIGETWNLTDRFGQLEALVEDWRQGGHSEEAQ